VKLGDVSMGLQRLEAGVEQLVRSEFGQYLPAFMGVLAEACIAVGQRRAGPNLDRGCDSPIRAQ
jgi:hypothetical protein